MDTSDEEGLGVASKSKGGKNGSEPIGRELRKIMLKSRRYSTLMKPVCALLLVAPLLSGVPL